MSTRTPPLGSLDSLPQEVLLQILFFLDLPDLFQVTRTSRTLRALACDPVLHAARRRHHVPHALSLALARRPAKATISPPHSWIWLSKTNVLSLQISKSLIRIRLSHNLEHRPSAQTLVDRAVLPGSCTSYDSAVSPGIIQVRRAVERQKVRDGLGRKLERRPSAHSLVELNILPEECVRRGVSPGILAARRRVIREDVKDGLRAWVEGRGLREMKRKRDEMEALEERTVQGLVRRFAARRVAVEGGGGRGRGIEPTGMRRERACWGREAELEKAIEGRRMGTGACSQPTRAHVLGLKRFWEGVIRTAAAS